jgi:hypothetical protein
MPTANHMPNFNAQADMVSPFSNTTQNIEPDRFDGSSTEWNDYIIHFEQAAAWNKWSDHQKACMLSNNLRGETQRLLSSLSPIQ